MCSLLTVQNNKNVLIPVDLRIWRARCLNFPRIHSRNSKTRWSLSVIFASTGKQPADTSGFVFDRPLCTTLLFTSMLLQTVCEMLCDADIKTAMFKLQDVGGNIIRVILCRCDWHFDV